MRPPQASADELTVIPVVTCDHHFYSKWDNILSSEGVHVTQAKTAYPGETLHLLVMFGRYATSPQGKCDLTFDFTRTDSAGEVQTRAGDLPAMKGPAGNPTSVQLARTRVNIDVTKAEALGDDTIQVTLHDNVSGQTATAETKFTVVPYGSDRKTMSFDEVSQLFSMYCSTPRPHEFFEFFKIVTELPDASRKDEMGMVLAPFVTTLLEDNPYHKPHFPEFWLALAPEQRRALLPVVKMITKGNPQMLEFLKLTDDERERLAKIQIPDFEGGDVEQPGELDMLWSEFYASGEIEPISKLARAMELAKDGDTDAKRLIGRAAIWSLGSNCRQSALVRSYCAYLAEEDQSLSDFVRAGLREMVEKSASQNAPTTAPAGP